MFASLSRRRRACALALALFCAGTSGCADFSAAAPTYTAQPSLVPAVVTPVAPLFEEATPTISLPSSRSIPSPGESSTLPRPTVSGSSGPADPCRPPDPAVIAACLSAPWGLVPLADGQSALVGERTTGRILKVAYDQKPVVITTVSGLDASGDGGLLGLAVSPSYAEDGLIYAYVTTATDNRILKIAAGDIPKPIFTGIPKGRKDNGGPIAFKGELLYVATGDTGNPTAAATATSRAGKVLRMDTFGHVAGGTLAPDTGVFASGLTAPTGICLLPTGSVGVVDHRAAGDLLLTLTAGQDYTTPVSGQSLWTWRPSDGGAADCASAEGVLANTSPTGQKLTGLALTAQGTFSGSPQTLLDNRYGRLLTVEAGPNKLFWLTTTNKDGHGQPVAADDRVVVIPNNGASGDGVD